MWCLRRQTSERQKSTMASKAASRPAADSIPPDAQEGAAPGLEIVGQGRAMPSEGGQSRRSDASTALSKKGLIGAPIAEKHISRKTGKAYYRFRNSLGKGYFISRATAEEMGFAWYIDPNNPGKGWLKNPKTHKFVSHEDAKTYLGSQAGSDVANLDEATEDELSTVEEDVERGCAEVTALLARTRASDSAETLPASD